MHRKSLWFVLEEGVHRECGTDVHDEIVYGAMPRMNGVSLVLEQIVDTFPSTPLAQHDFVPH